MNNIHIRKAVAEDARELAQVNIQSWFETYKGIMADDLLHLMRDSFEDKILMIAENIKNFDNIFVAEVDGKIVGFCGYGKTENKKFADSGEIFTLYLLKDYHGFGIGKKLFLSGIKALMDQGFNTMCLKVLEGNKTIYFYEKFGGVCVGIEKEILHGFEITENVMIFNDLRKIFNANR